jgi:hypothetical protein
VREAGVALANLILCHRQLRPRLEVQDVYKMLYQGVFGVGHIVGHGSHALECLRRELDSLDLRQQRNEQLVESIATDGLMARVNLRPFKRLGLSADTLFDAMCRSAGRNRGARRDLLAQWRAFMKLVEAGALEFDPADVRRFDRLIAGHGYPVLHHSREYARLYNPSYRVAEAAELRSLGVIV